MIVEHRTYTLAPGKLPEFINMYQELGAPHQIPILRNLIGVFTTEIGPLNQIIHLWAMKTPPTATAAAPSWPKTQNGQNTWK